MSGRSATDRIRVRRPTSADAEQLAALFRALNRHQRDPEEHMTLERVHADALGDDAWFETLVAEHDGVLVGYVCFHRSYETAFAAKGYYVQDLFVDEGWRQRGVGRALIGAVARHVRAQGAAFLWWTSRDWNGDAQAAYARWQATEEPVRAHAVFGEPFDALADAGQTLEDQ